MAGIPADPGAFVQELLSRLDATALVVGSMIGSGVFIVSADIVGSSQSPGLFLPVRDSRD